MDSPPDPSALARREARPTHPKRFYAVAEAAEEGGLFALRLDGRPARTPRRAPLAVRSRAVGEALAAEWSAQGETIDPFAMPLTRLVNSALDGVAGEMAAVAAEVANYAGSDLVCYRAGEPAALVAAQAAAWDPTLDWARATLGARFVLSEGVVFVAQPQASLDAVARAAAAFDDPVGLAGLHVMTTLTGSALIALRIALGDLDAAAGWDAAHADEDFQMRLWGANSEAMARRASRWREMQAAALAALAR